MKHDVDELGEDEVDTVTKKITHHEDKPGVPMQMTIWDRIEDASHFLYWKPFPRAMPSVTIMSLVCVALMALFIYVVYRVVRYWVKRVAMSNLAQQVADRRQVELFDNVNVDVNELLKLDVAKIRDAIIKNKFTCQEVTTVFIKRTYNFGRSLSLTGSEGFYEALKLAKQKDQELERAQANGTVDKLGPFFGVPFAVAD